MSWWRAEGARRDGQAAASAALSNTLNPVGIGSSVPVVTRHSGVRCPLKLVAVLVGDRPTTTAPLHTIPDDNRGLDKAADALDGLLYGTFSGPWCRSASARHRDDSRCPTLAGSDRHRIGLQTPRSPSLLTPAPRRGQTSPSALRTSTVAGANIRPLMAVLVSVGGRSARAAPWPSAVGPRCGAGAPRRRPGTS